MPRVHLSSSKASPPPNNLSTSPINAAASSAWGALQRRWSAAMVASGLVAIGAPRGDAVPRAWSLGVTELGAHGGDSEP